VAIRGTKANKETDKIIMAIKISTKVKPSDFKGNFNLSLHEVGFIMNLCKTYTTKILDLKY
jgi:hypothetical protein